MSSSLDFRVLDDWNIVIEPECFFDNAGDMVEKISFRPTSGDHVESRNFEIDREGDGVFWAEFIDSHYAYYDPRDGANTFSSFSPRQYAKTWMDKPPPSIETGWSLGGTVSVYFHLKIPPKRVEVNRGVSFTPPSDFNCSLSIACGSGGIQLYRVDGDVYALEFGARKSLNFTGVPYDVTGYFRITYL